MSNNNPQKFNIIRGSGWKRDVMGKEDDRVERSRSQQKEGEKTRQRERERKRRDSKEKMQ